MATLLVCATSTRNIPDSSVAYNRGVKTNYGQIKKCCDQNSNSPLIDMHKDKGYNLDQLLACELGNLVNAESLLTTSKYLTQGRMTIASAQ